MYDLIVVGSGPAGFHAAELAGKLGKRVLLIEADELGGTCTNRGCIPTKSLLHGAKLFHQAQNGAAFGVNVGSVSYDGEAARQMMEDSVRTLRGSITLSARASHVEIVKGTATCLDANHVAVGDTVYETDHLFVATGSVPAIPPIPGLALGGSVGTSDTALRLSTVPEKVAVIGGGVIGMEFASYFSLLGSEVDVIEMLPEILPMMDGELARQMRRALPSISFHLSCGVTSLEGGVVRYRQSDGAIGSLTPDFVLLATGRKPKLAGLDRLGLSVTRKGIAVDDHMRASVTGIWAIGDCNGKSLLAHSASRMAEIAVDDAFGNGEMTWDGVFVPWVVYGYPEACGCGLTEDEAKAQGLDVVSAAVLMRASARVLVEEGKRAPGLVKMVVRRDGLILGIHMMGPSVSELVWGCSFLIGKKCTSQDLAGTVFPHPSVSEVLKECAVKVSEAL